MCTRAMPSEDMKRHRKHNLRERFELVKTLGQGTYGKVKLAIEKRTGIKVSVFMIPSSHAFSAFISAVA